MDPLTALFAVAIQMSGYPPIPLPYTKVLPYKAMMVVACSGIPDRDKDETREACESRRGLASVFVMQTQRVLISDALDIDSIVGQSFVIHEYVHALQFAAKGAGMYDTCEHLYQTESEAYKVQQRYLTQNGVMMQVGRELKYLRCPEAR
jgi:hypothetical protein